MGGPDGKIFGTRSWRTDLATLGPYAMTSGQIFSRPARPNSVNKHFPDLLSYGDFLNTFAMKARAGPYGSYNKEFLLL